MSVCVKKADVRNKSCLPCQPQAEGHHLEIAQISSFLRSGGCVTAVKHGLRSKRFIVKHSVVHLSEKCYSGAVLAL